MDLVQTVRKEGSRGGVNFSWDDVKSSAHRENYLGHSLKAPVGRWQTGKDLNWYARADDADLTPEERAERERERKCEELKSIKQAEEDAMARALGLPVPDRTNANNEPLGETKITQREINKALKETLDDDETEEGTHVIGLKPHREDKDRDRADRSSRHNEHRERKKDRHRSRSRSRSRSGDRRRERHRNRSRDGRRRDHHERRDRHMEHSHSRREAGDRPGDRDDRRDARSWRHQKDRSRSPFRSERRRGHRIRSRSPGRSGDSRRDKR